MHHTKAPSIAQRAVVERSLHIPSTMSMQHTRIMMFAVLGLLAACATADSGDAGEPRSDVPSVLHASTSGPLSSAFATSAEKAGAPRDLLVAIAKVEDGLGMPAEREVDEHNEIPAAGPLQLRRGKLDTLRRGAELVGVSEVELRKKSDLALEAGALVLAELGTRTGARADDLASWAEAVAEMSGFADDLHRERYVHEVFALLARGGSFEGRDGEIVHLPPHPEIPPSLTIEVDTRVHTLATAQFPGAEWIPTSCNNKCTPTRDGNKVEYIVIHDTEGNWNASVATLQNDPGKSAHYIIGEDGRIAQFVTEETTAWHAGNFHFNQRSIGIEHVGYSTKPFPEPLYAKSAKLVEHLTKKYKIPRDRAHIIGHDQIPNGNKIAASSAPCMLSPKECRNSPNYGGASGHTDPGIWEWATYMVRFGGTAKCNDVTNLWNCSHDKKKAFRCADGKVEVATCDGVGGCEVQPLGTDDKCNVAPQTSSMPAEGTTTEVDATEPEPPSASGQPGTSGFLPPSDTRLQKDVDAGCSVGSRSHGGAGWMALLALALLAGGRARRRSPAS